MQYFRHAARDFCTIMAAALIFSLWPASGPAQGMSGGRMDIVALGDSLTAGYRLAGGEAFPAQLEAALKKRGHDVRVINAGVSGDTSQAGLARLDWSIPADAEAVIVALGANDALRGISPQTTRQNLTSIAHYLKARALPFIIAGIAAPTSLGADYTREFNAIFSEIAEQFDVGMMPNFLGGIPVSPKFVQADGMHPTAAGVSRIVENILPLAEELINSIEARRNAQ